MRPSSRVLKYVPRTWSFVLQLGGSTESFATMVSWSVTARVGCGPSLLEAARGETLGSLRGDCFHFTEEGRGRYLTQARQWEHEEGSGDGTL